MDESYRASQERYQKGSSNRAKARQIDDWMSAILPTELSSLRLQPVESLQVVRLECWNTGKMEYWVLGNWDFGLLEKFILTWEGIC